LEPVSHFFYSHRLKLQFWDSGTEGKPIQMVQMPGYLMAVEVTSEVAAQLSDSVENILRGDLISPLDTL